MTCGTVGLSADQVELRIKEETTTYGVAESGSPKYEALRFTGESLEQATATNIPAEIDGTGRTSDITRASANGQGDIQFALSYQSAAPGTTEGMDFLWEAALQSTSWAAEVQVTATTISFQDIATAANGNGTAEIDDSGNGLGGFTVNSIISVTGSTSNNFICKVTAVAAGTLEVRVLDAAGANDFTTEAAGDTVTITQGQYVTDGSTCRSYTIEREYTDAPSTLIAQFLGMVPSGFTLTVPQSGDITGAFQFYGKQETSQTSTSGDGSPNASETNDICTTGDNLHTFTENNAEFDIVSMGINWTVSPRGRFQAGDLTPASVGTGRRTLGGPLQAFFSNHTFFNKYLNFTETSFLVVVKDNQGNAYVFDIPAVKLTAGRRPATGIDTDIIADMTWQARTAATEGYMIRITRLDTDDVA